MISSEAADAMLDEIAMWKQIASELNVALRTLTGPGYVDVAQIKYQEALDRGRDQV